MNNTDEGTTTFTDEEEVEEENENFIKKYNSIYDSLDQMGLTDIGSLAAWTASSYKIGCNVDALRDESPDKFWQSDGPQPHSIDAHFSKKVDVKCLAIFTDYRIDESYTPSKIQILAGTSFHDLIELKVLDLDEPKGWIYVDVSDSRSDGVCKLFLIRFVILANHQNGKDTHIRGIKILSAVKDEFMDEPLPYTSTAFLSESVIR